MQKARIHNVVRSTYGVHGTLLPAAFIVSLWHCSIYDTKALQSKYQSPYRKCPPATTVKIAERNSVVQLVTALRREGTQGTAHAAGLPCRSEGSRVFLTYLGVGRSEKTRVTGDVHSDQQGIADEVADSQRLAGILGTQAGHCCCQTSCACYTVCSKHRAPNRQGNFAECPSFLGDADVPQSTNQSINQSINILMSWGAIGTQQTRSSVQ